MLRNVIQLPSRTVSPHVIVVPSDDEIKRVLGRFRPILSDGPVPVRGELIGWTRTKAGPVGAIYVNPLTSQRTLWGIDFNTRKPRCLASLS